MDKVIQKKTWTSKRLLMLAGIFLLIFLIGFSVYLIRGKSNLNVKAERLSIQIIKEDTFQEFIPLNGTVLPINSIFLDASVGGRVEEKYVEDGAFLKKGDPIMRLSNTDQELSLVNQETSVLNLLTQSQIAQTNAQQVSINNRNQLADVENGLKEAQRIYQLNKKLFEEKAIGSQEYQKTVNDYLYQKERMELTRKILQQDSLSTNQKVKQDRQMYERTQRALELMRKKVDDLVVRAPVDGQLTSFDSEIGQNKNSGERLGQIDVLTGFKVRADVDEHYISRIYNDLQGSINISNKTYTLRVRKVYSQVNNGRFQVDMEFVGEIPQGIRRGQTLQIKLALSDETKALLLSRGGFYQQSGGNWIFKLSEDGSTAYRTDIQLGRQNPEYYEVLKGLKPGDKVITSSYENYDKVQELKIQK
ncbi:efflux transporter, RND family, MFP subunit [Sphingobacterium spiritivorum ATCC 33300]|uniref:Efflux transporter, RND family, MFP subunit n=1 Tax=Sphingobacterium spiritivorum ATCC 33300 TaxID=525372 RepID=C2G0N9_SPHSI|nr:HlyD family efflux transporter periplasmic adaptor subunit [Sphingobacterium spiritivorum]EEI91419.1 efflux transporter, RND family, MFP subunit [Sphingobacterium spiritivorum ATCC 33300]QQS97513.1 HlyD family efflux transporter periplasmic adaptor subunit [Sphingobacterium spiritivorum]